MNSQSQSQSKPSTSNDTSVSANTKTNPNAIQQCYKRHGSVGDNSEVEYIAERLRDRLLSCK